MERKKLFIKHNGTPYVCWTGFVSFYFPNDYFQAFSDLVLAVVIPPYLISSIYRFSRTNQGLAHYVFLFDLEKNEHVWLYMNFGQHRRSTTSIKSVTYDDFYQINKDRK